MTDAEDKTIQQNEKLEKFSNQFEEYDPEVRKWIVEIYSEYGKHIHKQIRSIIKEDEMFFLYNTDSEFRNVSYDCYSKLIKKNPYIKDQTEMLFLFVKNYHRVESESRQYSDMPEVSDDFTDWIEKTKSKYQVNLLAFAFDWVNKFSGNEDSWPRTHKKKSSENWRDYEYDYKQKSNLFNLDSMYRRMPKKPFIKGRKQELEILFMYQWLHNIEGDNDYWPEYLSKVFPLSIN
jgi:hypothetical protein